MNEIFVSAQELMYLAAELGASEFFGLSDPFMGMTHEEIRSVIEEARLSLDQKGYAQMDFSGEFKIGDVAAALMKTCALCGGYISMDRLCYRESSRLLVYLLDGDVAVLSQEKDLLRLRACEASAAKELLLEAVGKIPEGTEFSPAKMEYEQLAALRGGQETQSDASVRCDGTLDAILSDGFGGKSDFALLVATDFERRRADSLMLLRTAAGSACITPREDGGWLLHPASRQTVLDWVDRAIHECGGKEG